MARSARKLAPVISPANPSAASEAPSPALSLAPDLPAEGPELAPETTSTPPEETARRISQPPARARVEKNLRQPAPHVSKDGQAPAPLKRRAKKPAAKPAPSVPPVVARRRELLGLALLALGILCGMALRSYRPNDGPWALPKRPTQNWVGPAGAMLADGLIYLLGLGAHVFAMGLVIMAGLCFKRRPPTPSRVQLTGASLTLLSAAIISHLALKGTGAVPYAPGGLLGALCGDGLARLFSEAGTAVIAGTCFAAGIVLCTDLSLSRLLRALVGSMGVVGERMEEWREVRRQRREVARELEEEALQAMLEQSREEEERQKQERAERKEKMRQAARLKAEMELERATREAQEAAEAAEAPSAEPSPDASVPPGAEAADITPAPAVDTHQGPQIEILPPHAPLPDAPAPAIVVDERPTEETPAQTELRIVDFVPRARQLEEKLNNPKDERPKPYGEKFELPPLSLLDYQADQNIQVDHEALRKNADLLVRTFRDYGIDGEIRQIRSGPVVTTYEFTPAAGIRVSKIAGMADDLAMALEAMSVRIVAPIPGRNAVGIEIPNNQRQNVYLKEIIATPEFQRAHSKLTLAMGVDIEGKPFVSDLAKMPHALLAGTTGSGKSVQLNSMILSMLYRATPDEVRLLMIDPKMLELKLYEGIPHLLLPPLTDPKRASLALRWAVEEMDRRYQLLADFGVRDISTFNKKMETLKAAEHTHKEEVAAEASPLDETQGEIAETVESPEAAAPAPDHHDAKESDRKAIEKNGGQVPEKLPYIVVIVDEFGDLMMMGGNAKDLEAYICRLGQKARACGIHVILATQRPSVDVVTGLIKANFPARIGMRVASAHDSKTIINQVGANRLLGNGDMLMTPPGKSDLVRVHGGYVTENEIERVVTFWKAQGKPQYNEAILQAPEEEAGAPSGEGSDEAYDEFFDQAVDIVARTRQVSISAIQRKLGVGYNRAAKMVERMEKDGLIGPSQGANKPREIFVRNPAEA